MTRYRILSALLAAATLTACGDLDSNAVQDITAPLGGARVKFFNFGVNAPGVNFYTNDTKVSAISNTACQAILPTDTTATGKTCLSAGIESTTGTAYGAAANGSGLYSAVPAGS